MQFKKYVLNNIEDDDALFPYMSKANVNYVNSVAEIPDLFNNKKITYQFTTGFNNDIDVYADPDKSQVYIIITSNQDNKLTEDYDDYSDVAIEPEDIPDYAYLIGQIPVIISAGKYSKHFASFDTEEEAEEFCEDLNWEWKDDHDFIWELSIESPITSIDDADYYWHVFLGNPRKGTVTVNGRVLEEQVLNEGGVQIGWAYSGPEDYPDVEYAESPKYDRSVNVVANQRVPVTIYPHSEKDPGGIAWWRFETSPAWGKVDHCYLYNLKNKVEDGSIELIEPWHLINEFPYISKDPTEPSDESTEITEDTVKRGNHWVNKGKEGTHGKFRTKKAADAQRKAMFANGYLSEDIDSNDITSTLFYKIYIANNPSIISKEDLNKIVASGLYDIIDFNTPYPASNYKLSKFKVINPDKVSLTFETDFIAQDLDDYTEASDIDAAAYGLKSFVDATELDPHITNIELIDNNFDNMTLMFTADEDFSNPGKYLFELSADCINGSIFDQDGPHGENYAKYDSDVEVDITVDISREN